MIHHHYPADIVRDILEELTQAERKHPNWPTDIIHAVAVMNEEAGEAIQAAIDLTYNKDPSRAGELRIKLREELIQTAAMCIRNLIHIRGVDDESVSSR